MEQALHPVAEWLRLQDCVTKLKMHEKELYPEVETFLKTRKNCLSKYVGSDLSLKRGKTILKQKGFGVSTSNFWISQILNPYKFSLPEHRQFRDVEVLWRSCLSQDYNTPYDFCLHVKTHIREFRDVLGVAVVSLYSNL